MLSTRQNPDLQMDPWMQWFQYTPPKKKQLCYGGYKQWVNNKRQEGRMNRREERRKEGGKKGQEEERYTEKKKHKWWRCRQWWQRRQQMAPYLYHLHGCLELFIVWPTDLVTVNVVSSCTKQAAHCKKQQHTKQFILSVSEWISQWVELIKYSVIHPSIHLI